MLDGLFNLFKSYKSRMFGNIVGTVENMVACFEQEFKQDQNAKNAAIDAVIKLLEAHKAPVTPEVPATPPTQPAQAAPAPTTANAPSA